VEGRGARMLVTGEKVIPGSKGLRSLLPALTTSSSGCRCTLFIFGLLLSPEGLRQSPSAVTGWTSILMCQVAGKFSALSGLFGPWRPRRVFAAARPAVPRRLSRAGEGERAWESLSCFT